MILVGLGSNLPHPEIGCPRRVCEAALGALSAGGATVERLSRWYCSSPLPASDQPDYVNGVAAVATALDPVGLLAVLHGVEERLGRTRSVPNAARVLDLDLLAYREIVRTGPEPPVLPHPRLAGRAFVLLPLRDVAPAWRHPATRRDIADLIRSLPPAQRCVPLPR